MKSYWIKSINQNDVINFQTLEKNIETDVCIIGGGLVGLQAAYNLSKYKIKTVLLEKDQICRSTSGKSTAKITSQHGLIYKYLINSKGMNFAENYYNANEEAIRNIEKIIKTENIDCEFEHQPSYVFTQKIQDVQKIRDEVEAVNSIGGKAEFVEAKDIVLNKLNNVEYVDNQQANINENVNTINQNNKNLNKEIIKQRMKNILPLKAIAGIKFESQAQFNPYKYAISLAKICSNSGIDIYENSRVVDVEDNDNFYTVELENGYKLKTKYLIVATKYPIINVPGFYFMKMYQSTSYAIAMETDKRLFEGMYINSEEPTISLRTAKIGDKYLLFVVGFDNKTGANIDNSNAYKYLEEIARKLCPDGKIKYHWNTEDCITLDKIPYIGQYSKLWPKGYVATGFNKWGITTSNIAANIITDNILGNKNKYEDIFTSTRVEPLKNRKELANMVKQGINSLIIKKMEIPEEQINQIQKGEGKIVEVGGEKIGVYKDENDNIYKIKPICRHLGCELSWNYIDKTWDCPCHGSRYDYKGNLIYGPSVKNLK